jgi:hypothetical protein
MCVCIPPQVREDGAPVWLCAECDYLMEEALNARDAHALTPLMVIRKFTCFTSAGAKAQTPTLTRGCQVACFFGHLGVAAIFLARGAEVDICDNLGPQFTCFPGTKVLSLLAFLVKKKTYKY